jgi:hypothetical protein
MKFLASAAPTPTDGTSISPRVGEVLKVMLDSFQSLATRTTSNEPAVFTEVTKRIRVAFSMSAPTAPAGRVERSNLIKVVVLPPMESVAELPNLEVGLVELVYASSDKRACVAKEKPGQKSGRARASRRRAASEPVLLRRIFPMVFVLSLS